MCNRLDKWLLLFGTIKFIFGFWGVLIFLKKPTNKQGGTPVETILYGISSKPLSAPRKSQNKIAINKRTEKSEVFCTQRHPTDCLWYILLKGKP